MTSFVAAALREMAIMYNGQVVGGLNHIILDKSCVIAAQILPICYFIQLQTYFMLRKVQSRCHKHNVVVITLPVKNKRYVNVTSTLIRKRNKYETLILK